MPKLTIDNRAVEVADGETILAAAGRLGIHIPTLCHIEGMAPLESCFVCAVQLAGREKLVPACAMPAAEGMEVITDSPEVVDARQGALELLLSDHLGECLAPCELACPATWDIPGFMQAIQAGDPDAAAEIAQAGLVLPVVLGHICKAPCQKACRRGRHDETVAIRELHKFAGQRPPRTPASPPQGRSVAIVGAGPAGLAAAGTLLAAGTAVTIYDAADAPGGSLRSLDQATLPVAALEADIAALLAAGASPRLGVRLGLDVTLDVLRDGFDAVLLALGDDFESRCVNAGGPAVADGKFVTDARTKATNVPGVFAAGACVGKAAPAVRVVADGLAAGAAIRQYLAGKTVTGPAKFANVRYGPLSDDEEQHLLGRAPSSAATAGPVDDDASSRAQADRCLLCGCRGHDVCKLRALATELAVKGARYSGARRRMAYDATHPDVVYESHKCVLCGACVRIADESGEKPGLTHVGRGFAARVSAPYEGDLGDALTAAAVRCADACPTSAFRRKGPHEPRTPSSASGRDEP